MSNNSIKRYLPFTVSILIIIVDQITKALVVKYIPERSIFKSYFYDFLRIIHVRNDAVAFSLGSSFDYPVKLVLFIIVPIVFMCFLIAAIVSKRGDKEFTTFQKYCLAGIVGGGTGNLIDRIFRSLRVVDFISTDMYGFLGFDRFPTYNIADASVVISVCLILLSTMIGAKKDE